MTEASGGSGIDLQELRKQLGPPRPGTAPLVNSSGGSSSSTSSASAPAGGAVQSLHAGQRRGLLERDDGDEEAQRQNRNGFQMTDPIFGPAVVPASQLSPTPLQCLGLACCPCCVLRGGPGCWIGWNQLTSPAMVLVWKRIRCKAAMLFVYVDLILFVGTIVYNGGFDKKNPTYGPDYHTLVVFGCKDMARQVYEYQWWRLVTPMVLHTGVVHLIFNLIATFRMGLVMEERWGTRKWLLIYLVSGFVGSLCSCAVHPDKPGVGASGALFGLLGAWLVATYLTWDLEEENRSEKYALACQCVVSTILGITISFVPYIDWTAHLGGWLAGALLAAGLFLPTSPLSFDEPVRGFTTVQRLRHRLMKNGRKKLVFLALAVVIAAFTVYVVCFVPVRPHSYQRKILKDKGQWPPRRWPKADAKEL